MGAAKYNPNHILAKQGLLPPKPKGLSKGEQDARLRTLIAQKTGITTLLAATGMKRLY